jgi:FkbM family methyltransferase
LRSFKIIIYRISALPVRVFRKFNKLIGRNKTNGVISPRLYSDKPVSRINFQFYDFSLRGFKCNNILDVGAHSTKWARTAKEYFPDSKIFMIEPLSEMEEKLKDFCKEFPGSKYFLNGAGAENGKLYLTATSELEGANFLQEENPHLVKSKVQREIDIITINSLIEKKEIEIPEIVKLDIQGFELEALKGGDLLFGKTEVFIIEASFFEFIEGSPLFSDVVQFMAVRGYEVYDFPGFLRRPFDNALGQIDITFVKRDGFFRNSNSWA